MTEHDNRLEARIAALEARDQRRESEHRSLLAVYSEAVAARETLRQDLQLNVDYLTQRLETLKARPAGGTDAESEDFDVIYQGLLTLLKFQAATDEQLRWLTGIVTRNMERGSQLLGLIAQR